MSKNSIAFRNKNQLFVNTDLTKTFVFNNDFYSDNNTFFYDNVGSDAVLIPEGTVLGRISSSGFLVPFTHAATDGSQRPVGILMNDVWVEYGETYQGGQPYCIRGHVAEQKIGLQGSDTLDTVVTDGFTAGSRVRDLITGLGIKIVYSDQNTMPDNS